MGWLSTGISASDSSMYKSFPTLDHMISSTELFVIIKTISLLFPFLFLFSYIAREKKKEDNESDYFRT